MAEKNGQNLMDGQSLRWDNNSSILGKGCKGDNDLICKRNHFSPIE